jgi:hypothetical protein
VVEAAAAEMLSGRETCLEIMDRVMRGDSAITTEQFIAAKELAPYRFPKLSAIAVAQKGERTLVDLIALAGGNRDSAPAIVGATAEIPSAQLDAGTCRNPPIIDGAVEPSHKSAYDTEREKLLSLRERAVVKDRQQVVAEIDDMLKELG